MSNSNFGSETCQSHFYIPLQIDASQGKVLAAEFIKKLTSYLLRALKRNKADVLLLFFL